MQTDDLVVRVLPLGGVWETLGVDRLAGIVPENFTATANEWGSDTAGFDLHRDPGAPHLDLMAFTPLEAEVAGELVWSGRTIETPARDGDDPLVNVQAQGWQYHLDDDVYAKAYVHTRLGEWRDARTFPTCDLTSFQASGSVAVDGGLITLTAPQGIPWLNTAQFGVVLDLGPYATASRILVTYDYISNGNSNLQLRLNSSPVGPSSMNLEAFAGLGAATTGTGLIMGGSVLARRYYILSLLSVAGANFTPTADISVRIKSVQVFASSAYESGNASILKASDVVKDAVAQACPLITDTTQVQATTFSIPDLHFEDTPQSPREVITAVNALHNYITKVDADKRIVFAPRPASPLYEIGAWGGADFQDASAGSGADVYSHVIVSGTAGDGTPLLQSVSPTYSSPQAAGPVTSNEAITNSPAGPFYPTRTVTRNWRAGVTYLVSIGMTQIGSPPTSASCTITLPNGDTASQGISGFFSEYDFAFLFQPTKTQLATAATITLAVTNGSGSAQGSVTPVGNSIIERRAFVRSKALPVNAALTAAVATQIGGVYLAAHQTQPLKGNVNALPTGVRRITGGDVHPAHLLRETGQRLRLSHRTDPDTGGQGRDGMIATVAYDHNARSAAIAIDEDRRNFDVLLARFAALSPA